MKEFKFSFLAQYINHILGEDKFDIKAYYNDYVGDSKVKGTLQGTINPVFLKNVHAYSSSLQLSFEVPADNNAVMQGYMEKIESICGMSQFNIDASYIQSNEQGEETTVENVYTCLMQLQADRPLTAPSESNGYMVILIMLTGSVLITKQNGFYGQPYTGFDVITRISIPTNDIVGSVSDNLAIVSLSAKIVKQGDSHIVNNKKTLTPYMTASNTFYTIDCYDLQRDVDKILCKHIERKQNANVENAIEPELIVTLQRFFPDGSWVEHQCMILSDSQIIESPSTFKHYILNLQTMD